MVSFSIDMAQTFKKECVASVKWISKRFTKDPHIHFIAKLSGKESFPIPPPPNSNTPKTGCLGKLNLFWGSCCTSHFPICQFPINKTATIVAQTSSHIMYLTLVCYKQQASPITLFNIYINLHVHKSYRHPNQD